MKQGIIFYCIQFFSLTCEPGKIIVSYQIWCQFNINMLLKINNHNDIEITCNAIFFYTVIKSYKTPHFLSMKKCHEIPTTILQHNKILNKYLHKCNHKYKY